MILYNEAFLLTLLINSRKMHCNAKMRTTQQYTEVMAKDETKVKFCFKFKFIVQKSYERYLLCSFLRSLWNYLIKILSVDR